MNSVISGTVLTVALSAAAMSCTAAGTAGFPVKPVRVVVGYAPGGGTDILARTVARKLADAWGQPVVVENRAGAGGNIAASLVAQSTPDGYTVLMITSNHSVPQGENPNIGFDPVKSFAPVVEIAYIPSALVVNNAVQAGTVKELISAVRAKPGTFNFGSTGTASAQYMDMQLFMNVTGTRMVNVTYKGAGQIVVALIGNEVQLSLQPMTAYLEAIRAGRLKALAVTGSARSRLLPNVPTYGEIPELKGFSGSSNWYGIVAPAGTPAVIVRRVHDDMVKAVETPEAQKFLADQAFVVVNGSPDSFSKTISADIVKWANLARSVEAK
jgi:tripartite-type tricarboxylate transporter receptor subunit TctC